MRIYKAALALAVTAALSSQSSTPARAGAPASNKPRALAGPNHAQPHFKYPYHSKPSGGSVLYDQTATAENGVPVQNFQSSYDGYDSEAADDFVVTDASGWSVSAFNFQVQFQDQNGAAQPPPDAVYDVDIYADAAGLPGAPACSYAGLSGAVDPTATSLAIALPTVCSLQQGTYWLSMTPHFDFPPQAFWSGASGAPIGAAGVWRNPLGGFGAGCTSWSEISTCVHSTAIIGGGDVNYLFQVIGAVGASAACNAGNLCLVSTVGTDTAPGACAKTDSIDVSVGDQVNFCYTITNNTGVELDYHTLRNNIDGALFTLMHQPVPGNGTFQFNVVKTLATTNIYDSAWTGFDVLPGYAATVESGGGGNCSDRIFADGFDNTPLPCPSAGNFVDITSTGNSLGLGDDNAAGVSMPFSFDFYGTTSNQLCVDNNGFAAFYGGACSDFDGGLYDNIALPAASLPTPAIMPLWDDFSDGSGDVYTDIRGTTPNRQFIVEWFNRVHYAGSSNTDGATFELILNEDGTLQFEYADVDYTAIGNLTNDPDDCTGGVCATIGLQNDATLFDQFSAFEASVTNNSGIKWTPVTPQIFTATNTATVSVGAAQIVVNPSPITGTMVAGGSSDITFAIENIGNRDLNWTLNEAPPADFHFPFGPRYAPSTLRPGEKDVSAVRPSSAWKQAHHIQAKPGSVFKNPMPNASGTPSFGCNIVSSSSCSYVAFDADAPGTLNVLAAENEVVFGGSFVADDFTKEYVVGYPSGDLQTIDTATGAVTDIGATGQGTNTRDIAYDEQTGTLFGTAIDGTGTDLFTIDTTTGAMSLVAPITGLGTQAYVMGLAVNPNDGLMYGIEIVTSSLVAIDKTSGNATVIGALGYTTSFGQGLDFNAATNTLYLASIDYNAATQNMYTVDTTTGLATLIGPIGNNVIQLGAFAIAVPSGPCAQPADQPWLSLGPTSGATLPGGSTPVNASVDGTNTQPGDILSGTICAISNDPAHKIVATPITVTVVAPALIPPTLAKAFNPSTVEAGTPSTLTITLGNANASAVTLTAALADAFPPGLQVAPVPNASSTCGGAVTADPGSDGVTLDIVGSVIPPSGTCTVSVDVETSNGGSFANSIPANALQTSAGDNATSADATLVVLGPPIVGEIFNPQQVDAGTPSTLTITFANANAVQAIVSAPFIDALPTGLVVAGAPNATTTCGGTVNAIGGKTSFTMDNAGAAIPASGICTISVDVVAATPNSYVNDIPAGTLQTDAGSNTIAADATLDVQAIPPTLTKAFSPASVQTGNPSTLTITLGNANAAPVGLVAALSDSFPAGLFVAAVPNASTTCGGAITAVAGTDSVTLDSTGASIPAAGTCTVMVDVEAVPPAEYDNVILAGKLQTAAGTNATDASASLTVSP